MDDLPSGVPQGTEEITRVMRQPQDEIPEIEWRDGKPYSKDPTKPKEQAFFAVQEIKVTFDLSPLQHAIHPFVQKQDIDGIMHLLKNSEMDITQIESHLFVKLKPGK